jgi:hypothetical protein
MLKSTKTSVPVLIIDRIEQINTIVNGINSQIIQRTTLSYGNFLGITIHRGKRVLHPKSSHAIQNTYTSSIKKACRMA